MAQGQFTDEDIVAQPKQGKFTDEDIAQPDTMTEAGAAASPPVAPVGITPTRMNPPLQTAIEGIQKAGSAVAGAKKSYDETLHGSTIGKKLDAATAPIGKFTQDHPYLTQGAEMVGGLMGGEGGAVEDSVAHAIKPPAEMPNTQLPAVKPQPAGVIGKMIAPAVAPGMGEEATANMQDVQARRGTESMFKAAAPSASDLDFRERLSQAAPDLSQLAKEKPLRSGGGIINPDFRVRELVSNLNDYMDNLWKQEYAPQIKNAADAPAPLDQLKQSMKQTISQIDREKQPGLVASLEDELMRMPERETVGQLENRRVQLSDKLNRYYKANPAEQVAMENQNFNVAATKAEYEATLDVLDRTLKLNGEAGGMGPRGRYGNLAEVRSYIAKQMNPTEQATMMQHLAQIVLRRGPERLITGALANPSAGRQVASGMELLGRSELAPPITPGQTEPFPKPKQLSENASGNGLTPMERGPEGKGGPDTTISRKIITPAPHPYQEAGLPREQIPAPPNQGGITRREPGDKPIFIEGKPTTTIEDTQESTNKALRVLRDPNASAADKVKARARLRFMPSAQEKQTPTPTPSKWGRFGRKNIGRPVIR